MVRVLGNLGMLMMRLRSPRDVQGRSLWEVIKAGHQGKGTGGWRLVYIGAPSGLFVEVLGELNMHSVPRPTPASTSKHPVPRPTLGLHLLHPPLTPPAAYTCCTPPLAPPPAFTCCLTESSSDLSWPMICLRCRCNGGVSRARCRSVRAGGKGRKGWKEGGSRKRRRLVRAGGKEHKGRMDAALAQEGYIV